MSDDEKVSEEKESNEETPKEKEAQPSELKIKWVTNSLDRTKEKED